LKKAADNFHLASNMLQHLPEEVTGFINDYDDDDID